MTSSRCEASRLERGVERHQWRRAMAGSRGRSSCRRERRADRSLDRLRERLLRPGPGCRHRRHHGVHRPGLDRLRERRERPRRLGRRTAPEGSQPNPNSWIAARPTSRRRPPTRRSRRPSITSPRSSTSWPTSLARTRSRRPAASSTRSTSALPWKPDPARSTRQFFFGDRAATTSWSSTRSPTSGSATASRSTRGSTLAERRLRDLRRVAVERGPGLRNGRRDLRRVDGASRGRRGVLGPPDRRPGPGRAVRLPGLHPRRA